MDKEQTADVIHNNIKSTKPRIDALLSMIDNNKSLTIAEQSSIHELLNHCLTSTNGRSIEQKIQDMTEVIANIAAYSVENKVEVKDLILGIADSHKDIYNDFVAMSNTAQEKNNAKFD